MILAALLVGSGSLTVGQAGIEASVLDKLKRLFPAATSFTPKEGEPHLTVPDLPVPEHDLPPLPKVEMPPFPEVELPPLPKVEMPPFPEVELPPKPELPAIPGFHFPEPTTP